MRERKADRPPGFARILRVGFFIFISLVLLTPGCKLGKNPTIPDGSGRPEPFMPDQPGTPMYGSGSSRQVSEYSGTMPHLEFIEPEEIIDYEYPMKLTILQTPEFIVKLHNFDGTADSSMFKCFIDGEKVTPSYNPADQTVSFSPDWLLDDGRHDVLLAFNGTGHLNSTGLSFIVCTEPPNITAIMFNPKNGQVKVCLDRAVETSYGLNMDNWKINDTANVFDSGEVLPEGAGTQIILHIVSKDDIPPVGPDGYIVGYHAKEGLTTGILSNGPIDWDIFHEG